MTLNKYFKTIATQNGKYHNPENLVTRHCQVPTSHSEKAAICIRICYFYQEPQKWKMTCYLFSKAISASTSNKILPCSNIKIIEQRKMNFKRNCWKIKTSVPKSGQGYHVEQNSHFKFLSSKLHMFTMFWKVNNPSKILDLLPKRWCWSECYEMYEQLHCTDKATDLYGHNSHPNLPQV